MYEQISRNKRNSVLFMIGFGLLFAIVGLITGYALSDLWISLWVFIGITIYIILQYYFSSKLAILMTRAKPMDKEENPRLYRMVENMAITIGIPKPDIYIINSPAPNAFAAGKSPEDAIIGFTTGLVGMLNKQELEGVISHEMGHIKNYDVRFKTIIMAMVAAIALLVDISLRLLITGGRNKNAAPLMLIGLAVIVIIWPLSHLMQAAVGREREYLADVTGAEITRYPEGLASALLKIGSYEGDRLKVSTSASMLFFDSPEKKKKSWFRNLTATHPDIEDRVERLRSLGM